MKKAQLQSALVTGEKPLAIVEYRGSTAVYSSAGTKKFRNETYEAKEKVVLHHRCEIGPRKEQIEILETLMGERLPKEPRTYVEKFNNTPLPMKPGTLAVWTVDQWAIRDFDRYASGTLEPLED